MLQQITLYCAMVCNTMGPRNDVDGVQSYTASWYSGGLCYIENGSGCQSTFSGYGKSKTNGETVYTYVYGSTNYTEVSYGVTMYTTTQTRIDKRKTSVKLTKAIDTMIMIPFIPIPGGSNSSASKQGLGDMGLNPCLQ